jgi:ketosteroid isomerase-like protein
MKLHALVLVLFAACHAPSGEASRLLAADRGFAEDTRLRRLEGWLESFDEHGSQVAEDFRPITGHAAIREFMASFFADPANELVWEPDTVRLSEGGNLGATSGRWTMTRKLADGSIERSTSGRYFDVWRRLPDGTWKLLYDVGEPDAEPAR